MIPRRLPAAPVGIDDTVAMNVLATRSLPRFASTVLTLVLCLLAAPRGVAAWPVAAPTGTLAQQINAHIGQPRFAAARWGIAVVSLDDGRLLYAHHADELLQPASTAKLFTAALSLATLGPDYRIPTRLLATGRVHDGRLDGSLILYGRGDPTLGTATSSDWAEQLAAQLAAARVTRIRGDLIADDSYFTGPSFGSGWEAGDLQSWFAVPSSALSVGENVVTITVAPGLTAGRPAQLQFDPPLAQPEMLGKVRTTSPATAGDINLYRAPGANTLYAFGTVAVNAPPEHFKLAVDDPALLGGRTLQQALARRGIGLTGALRVLHWPQDDSLLLAHAHALAQVWSPTVLDMLQRGLKRSQNLYLQNLLLSVGAQQQVAAPDTAFLTTESYGVRALHALLRKIGVAPSAALIDEGSGLSRRDLVTPNALVRILTYLAAQPYADAVRAALPIAGVDGTLIRRMRQTAAERNVHAKTGSMSYVNCMAGYVTSAAGERLVFAIMLNNYQPPADGPHAGSDVDAIALMLANYRGGR
jgi:D-alanyl-D-alanine carboxypeptidase/D-alanyl-D-alanine-endopeptidase (penicillin-binding protein 4)